MDFFAFLAVLLLALLAADAVAFVRFGRSTRGIYAWLDDVVSARARAHARARETLAVPSATWSAEQLGELAADPAQAVDAALIPLLEVRDSLARDWRPEWGRGLKVERQGGRERPRAFVRRARAWAAARARPASDGDRTLDILLASGVVRCREDGSGAWEIVDRPAAVVLLRRHVARSSLNGDRSGWTIET